MKMRFLSGLFLISVFMPCYGQEDTVYVGALSAYIVPLPWWDANPRLRLGMDYHTHYHIGYSVEVGIGSSSLNQHRLKDVVWGDDYSLFEIRPEIKWYKKEESEFATYFALEFSYLHMKDFLTNNTYFPDKNSAEFSYDSAHFLKNKFGAMGKFGAKFFIAKRFVFDLYGGMGLAYRKITYYDVINAIPIEFNESFDLWGESYKNAGQYVLLQFSLGCRVGYVFGKM